MVIWDKAIADTYLILHIGSIHTDETYKDEYGVETKYNQKNLGGGIGYDINNNIQVRAGGYDNSYDNLSLYAMGLVHTNIRSPVAIGAQAGLVSGYGNKFHGSTHTVTQLVIVPVIYFRYKRVAAELIYIPEGVAKSGSTVLSTSIRF